VILLVCIEESVVGNILEEEHAGFGARAREVLILLLASYVLFGTVRPGSIVERYFPTILTLYPTILAGVGWLFSVAVHRRLRSREYFMKATDKKRQRDLHQAIRELTPAGVATLSDLRRVRGIGGTLSATLTIIVILAWSAGAALRAVSVLAYAATCVCFFTISILLSVFEDEFIYLGDGLRLRRIDMRRKLAIGAGIIFAAVSLATILASDRSLLSLDLFTRLFDWLSGLLPDGEATQQFRPQLSPRQLQDVEALRRLEEMLRDQEPSRFWIALVRTLRSLLIAAAVVGLMVLVTGPFMSEEFAERLKGAHPLRAVAKRAEQLKRWFFRMIRLARRWWKHLDLRAVLRADAPSRSQRQLESVTATKRGIRKRRQVSRITSRFFELIRWSTKQGYGYRKSFVPSEYAARLAAAFPSIGEDLRQVIGIYEEVMYSPHVVGRRKIRAFDAAIDRITRSTSTNQQSL
jgi:hypothetical protein